MPGSVTTLEIRDGNGTLIEMRAWDESGAGGPYSFFTVLGADAVKLAKVDDAAFTPGTSEVVPIAAFADETATDSVDEGDAGAVRMTLDRKLIVAPQPHAKGGCSIFRSIDLDEGTLEVVKGSPGCVYGMWVSNLATSTRFIKFYDATSGTAGTGTPVITIAIPGNSTDDVSGNFGPGGVGIEFATGICVGAVTGVADNDTGAPGANEVLVNIFYK
jgi:hypothetical protein